MKLFLQVVAFVLVIVALVWAKKHFLDKPPAEPAATTAESQAGTATPQPTQSTDTAAATSKLANLIHSFSSRGDSGTPQVKARVRMEAFMKSWKEGGTSLGDAEQAAACLWSRGKVFIPDRDEIQDAYNGFTKFRRDKDLYTNINEYAIGPNVDRAHDEGHGDYSVFAVSINGKTYLMGVPDKANPIFWIG